MTCPQTWSANIIKFRSQGSSCSGRMKIWLITSNQHPDIVAVRYESTYDFSSVINYKPTDNALSHFGHVRFRRRDSLSEYKRQTPPSVIGVCAAAYLCVYASRVFRGKKKIGSCMKRTDKKKCFNTQETAVS